MINRYIFLVLSIVVFSFAGCNKKKGCLDINASNFDVSADKNCDDCCQYPTLSINLATYYADSNFLNADSVYRTASNDSFQIKELKFFMSGFRMSFTDGKSITVADTFQYLTPVDLLNPKTAVKDIIIGSGFSFNNTVGSFVSSGNLNKFSFQVGLSPEINQTRPNLVSSTNILTVQSDTTMYRYPADGYNLCKISILLLKDSTTRQIFIPATAGPFNIDYTTDTKIYPGINALISLRLFVKDWFENVDINSEEAIKNSVLDKISYSFK